MCEAHGGIQIAETEDAEFLKIRNQKVNRNLAQIKFFWCIISLYVTINKSAAQISLYPEEFSQAPEHLNPGTYPYGGIIDSSRFIGGFPNHRPLLFSQPAFMSQVFRDDVDFNFAIFEERVFFVRSEFKREVGFLNTHFKRESYWGMATFDRSVSFERAQFYQLADFRFATFNHVLYSWSTHFSDKVDFAQARFNGGASFSEAQFDKALTLKEQSLKVLWIYLEPYSKKELTSDKQILIRSRPLY